LIVMHGLDDQPGTGGPIYRQELPATIGTPVLNDLITKVFQPGDVLAVGSLPVLSDSPSGLLAVISLLMSKGVTLLVADLGGPPDLRSLGPLVKAFLPIETEVLRLNQQIADERRQHKSEMDDFSRSMEAQLVDMLKARGVGLTGLLKSDDAPKVPRPDEGRELQDLRRELGLTGEMAGKLVVPKPIDKGTVSRIEKEGSAHPQFATYSAALNVARVKRDKAAKAKAEAEATQRDPYRLPVSGEEVAAMAIQEAGGLAS
jgi:transcriptional regulator with XRE-family HTH domain